MLALVGSPSPGPPPVMTLESALPHLTPKPVGDLPAQPTTPLQSSPKTNFSQQFAVDDGVYLLDTPAGMTLTHRVS